MKTSLDRIPLLDGLRGIAIVLVVWFHYWQMSWFDHGIIGFIPATGYLGVEMFFFISGFCLYYPYSEEKFSNVQAPTTFQYIFKRALKILPSYWLCILAVLFIFGVHPSHQSNLSWHLITHFFFIHTWFPETWGSINGVLWSLAVEVQFYVIFPFLYQLFKKNPPWCFIALAIVATTYRGYIQTLSPDHLHFWLNQIPGTMDLFAAGMLSAYVVSWLKTKDISYHQQMIASLFALLFILLFLYLLHSAYVIRYQPNGASIWQTQNRLWLGLTFSGLTISSFLALRFWKLAIANPILVFFSAISYNWYIWHQYLAFQLSSNRIPASANPEAPYLDPAWRIPFLCLAIATSIAIAALLTYGFERPILKWGTRWLKTGNK